jgi:hypothetical protein
LLSTWSQGCCYPFISCREGSNDSAPLSTAMVRRKIGWLVARTGDRCGFGLSLCLGYPGNCCPWVPLASAPSAAARYGRLHHRMKSHGKIGKINRKAFSGVDRCLCLHVGGIHGNPRPEITAALNTRSAKPNSRSAKWPSAQLQRALGLSSLRGVQTLRSSPSLFRALNFAPRSY